MSAPITLHGRLGADPELRFLPSGMAVAKLRVVTNTRKLVDNVWTDSDTSWWEVACFKSLAENVAESLSKGDAVIVVGKVTQRTWETPQGEKRSTFEVTADHLGPDLARGIAKPTRVTRPATSGFGGTAAEVDPWVTPADSEGAVPF